MSKHLENHKKACKNIGKKTINSCGGSKISIGYDLKTRITSGKGF
jgi:hypothetical protein